MAHFARRVPIRLRILQANGNLTHRWVPASIAMIPLARAGDVYGLGLVVGA